MNATLSEVVYKAIFPPEGSIPLKAKRNIQAIDARIKEIEDLAEGRAVEGMTRRISSRSESQSLTEQIVQLRDSCSPPMSYKEIMRRLGYCITPDAARNRYDDYKQKLLNAEAYTAMSGESQQKTEMHDHVVEPDKMILIEIKPVEKAKPVQDDGPGPVRTGPGTVLDSRTVEAEATTRNSRIVQESAEVEPDDATLRNVATDIPESIKGMRLSDFENGKGPLRQDQKDKILEMWDKGFKVPDIQCSLGIKDGRKITGVIRARELHKKKGPQNVAPVQPEALKYPSLPGVEGAPEGAARPAPKSISRADLNIRIWDAYQAGDPIEKISADLNSEGYYYDERQVRNRLRQQGADL